jgi:hypothetical protein
MKTMTRRWSDDPSMAFRESYAVARQQALASELGMGDPDDEPLDDGDDVTAPTAATMRHTCSCGHENRILPPLGYWLSKTAAALAGTDFRSAYEAARRKPWRRPLG